MPRSLVRGDYSLLMAIESSSRPNSWYRVLTDRQSRLLSCDCPVWTFNRQSDEQGHRACQHTTFTNRLVTNSGEVAAHRPVSPVNTAHPLLAATQTQWPGLHGIWSIEERDANIGTKPYHFVLLRLAMGNGGTATGVVAFANAHHHTTQEMIPGVAGWAGYAIAAEVARLAGHPFMGQVPEHFQVNHRPSTRQRQRPTPTGTPRPTTLPAIGLRDILRVGDIVDLGDGLTPSQRAANTLRLFVGEDLFSQLERQGFLDISSVKHQGRVYRLRRDPDRERRIRVWEEGVYKSDFCVVSAMEVPPDDLFLTVMLGLMSDEDITLSVVNPRFNIFPPNSDGNERETVPAIWRPRVPTVA